MTETRFAPIELSYVIPLYFDQQNHDSLTELLTKYAQYDGELLDRLQFVLVDDGSPVRVAVPPGIDLNIFLLRIREDILWNQGGARNLGVVYARSDNVLATDLDHEFSEETLRYLAGLSRLGRTMYRFHRRNANGEFVKPHPNSFVFSRGRFLELYGVDEEFSGHYGCEDGMFWRWQRYNGTRFRYLSRGHAPRLRRIDHDRSYHSLTRDTAHNLAIKKRKQQEWATVGPYGGHSRRFLTFTWDVVEDRRRRSSAWMPPQNRLWKPLWPLRWLFG